MLTSCVWPGMVCRRASGAAAATASAHSRAHGGLAPPSITSSGCATRGARSPSRPGSAIIVVS